MRRLSRRSGKAAKPDTFLPTWREPPLERPAEAAGIAVAFAVAEPLLVTRSESLPIDICIRGARPVPRVVVPVRRSVPGVTGGVAIAPILAVVQSLLVPVGITVVERRVIQLSSRAIPVGIATRVGIALALLAATNCGAGRRLHSRPIPPALTAPFPSVDRMSCAASTERRPTRVAAT